MEVDGSELVNPRFGNVFTQREGQRSARSKNNPAVLFVEVVNVKMRSRGRADLEYEKRACSGDVTESGESGEVARRWLQSKI